MANSFLRPIQRMLKQLDLKVSDRTIKGFLEDIDQAAPWFRASGDINLPSWEKLGRDLTDAKGRGELWSGTLPLWHMIRYCLKDGKCVDILREGRRALSAHQDNMSESDNITLSDSAEDELDSEEEEDLEEAAATYKSGKEESALKHLNPKHIEAAAIKAMVLKGQIMSLLGTQLSFLFPVFFHYLSISLRIEAKIDIMIRGTQSWQTVCLTSCQEGLVVFQVSELYVGSLCGDSSTLLAKLAFTQLK
ncbi:hypothetical protein STEG23_022579 [Scotinomys teguina]